MQPTILTYNLSTKQFQLELLCANFQVHIRNILPTEQSFVIKSVLENLLTPKNTDNHIFTDEMVVFCNFDDSLLDLFLQQLRNLNIRIPLKAVLTPTNYLWNSIELHKELSKEYNVLNERK